MRNIMIASILIILTASMASAQEITLKKSFWSGWRYSTGDMEWHKIGVLGEQLMNAMAENDAAVAEMRKYRSRRVLGYITGIPAVIVTTWSTVTYISHSPWKDEHTTMLVIGVPLLIVAWVCEASADRALQRAVRIYNGDDMSFGLEINVPRPLPAQTDQTLTVSLSWRF